MERGRSVFGPAVHGDSHQEERTARVVIAGGEDGEDQETEVQQKDTKGIGRQNKDPDDQTVQAIAGKMNAVSHGCQPSPNV